MLELSDTEFSKVSASMNTLACFPGLAKSYVPYYEATLPPENWLYYVVPKTSKVLFLSIDETQMTIEFYSIVDARSDPANRFM
jgi:hypothetical protein